MGTMTQTGLEALVDGTLDFASGTDFRVALTTSAYTPDPDHDDMADITNELSGGAYARVASANEAIVVDDANNQIECDGDDVTFASL